MVGEKSVDNCRVRRKLNRLCARSAGRPLLVVTARSDGALFGLAGMTGPVRSPHHAIPADGRRDLTRTAQYSTRPRSLDGSRQDSGVRRNDEVVRDPGLRALQPMIRLIASARVAGCAACRARPR